MDFCILCDTDKLERYATLSRVHLCLAQNNEPEYWKFYERRRVAGDFIILDNGAYEGEVDWNMLKYKLGLIDPNVCVLPDYLFHNWQKTYIQSRKFLDEYYTIFPDTQWMYVPQAFAGDIVGWSVSLVTALEDKRISWVGLPRALAYSYTRDTYIRARIAQHLKRIRPDIKIHALGMINGNIDELNVLVAEGNVESIDSHWPCKGRDEEEIFDRLEECGIDTVDVRSGS